MNPEYLSLAEIQEKELEILKAFDGFCRAHGLVYTLLFGSLLGAIRHKGFVPWDEDIDVGMPRPDYEWMLSNKEVFEAETGYELVSFKGLPYDIAPFCKLIDRSIAVEERGSTVQEYLWIDLFPIDSLPDNERSAKRLCNRINRLRLLFVAITTPIDSALTLKRKIVKALIKPIGIFVTEDYLAHKIAHLARMVDYGTSTMVNAITWTTAGFAARFDKSGFENMDELQFEDGSYYAITNWDDNLRGAYGDYMRLPDESKRIAHSLIAWQAKDDLAHHKKS